MTRPPSRARRPAARSRWAATGLTAAVTMGAVAAMSEAQESTENAALDDVGASLGAIARYEGEVAAAAMMAAADPGGEIAPPNPPRLARADVS